jgi:hypothetical protein
LKTLKRGRGNADRSLQSCSIWVIEKLGETVNCLTFSDAFEGVKEVLKDYSESITN